MNVNVTLKMLAQELNLSYTTVSRALRGDIKIKKETRERVQKKAQEMNYIPNSIAQELVGGKTNTIGLIVPDITDPFIAELAKELSEEAQKEGLTLYLCNTNWNDKVAETYFKKLIEKRVDGILILPTSGETKFIEEN